MIVGLALAVAAKNCSSPCICHHSLHARTRIVPLLSVQYSTYLEPQSCLSNGIVSGKLPSCFDYTRALLLTIPEMFTPTKGRVAGGGKAANHCDSNRIGYTAPFQPVNSFKVPMATASFESDGSTSAGSHASSGQSMSQVSHSDATVHPTTSSRGGQVDTQPLQAIYLIELA